MSTNEPHKVALVFYSLLEGSGNSATYRNLMFGVISLSVQKTRLRATG